MDNYIYPTVCLCGSTKFKDTFEAVARALTLNDMIVVMPNVWHHLDETPISEEDKAKLDKLHRRKIEKSDYVYVINPDGYIGESTAKEIEYAKSLERPIFYLEALTDE